MANVYRPACTIRHAVSAYANYADPTLRDPALEYWGANRARLREVKRRVDPQRRIVFPQAVGA